MTIDAHIYWLIEMCFMLTICGKKEVKSFGSGILMKFRKSGPDCMSHPDIFLWFQGNRQVRLSSIFSYSVRLTRIVFHECVCRCFIWSEKTVATTVFTLLFVNMKSNKLYYILFAKSIIVRRYWSFYLRSCDIVFAFLQYLQRSF